VTINLARRRRTLSTFFFLQTPTSKLDDEEKSTAVTRNEEDDTYNEKIEKTSMKNDDSLPQKNVPHHDDRFIHRCQVRLCEDNQLYMLPSIYLINIRRFYIFFTHSLMLDSREKERETRMVLLRLGFNDEERKEKCLLYHPVEEMKKVISGRQDHSLEHPVLKTSWLASKVRSSARRRR
jgi:hypothetical protein